VLAFSEYGCNDETVLVHNSLFFTFDGNSGGGGVGGNSGPVTSLILQPGIYQVQFKGLASLSTDGSTFGAAGQMAVSITLDNVLVDTFLLNTPPGGPGMAGGSKIVKVASPNQTLGFTTNVVTISGPPVSAAHFNMCFMSILQLQ